MSSSLKHKLDLALDVFTAKRRRTNWPKVPKLGEEYFAPGQNSAVHSGFVNCAHNDKGLRAKFFKDENGGIACVWNNADRSFEGYPGLIHGGVLSSLLDEVMANAVVASEGVFGVTTKMTIKWLKPIKTGQSVTGSGRIVARIDKLRVLLVEGVIFRNDGKVAATAEATFFLPTASQFAKIAAIDSIPAELKCYFSGGRKP